MNLSSVDILGWGSIVCVVGCLPAFLVFTHQIPVATLPPPPGYDDWKCLLEAEFLSLPEPPPLRIENHGCRWYKNVLGFQFADVGFEMRSGQGVASSVLPWTVLSPFVQLELSSGGLLRQSSALRGVLNKRLWERIRTQQLAVYAPQHHLRQPELSDPFRVSLKLKTGTVSLSENFQVQRNSHSHWDVCECRGRFRILTPKHSSGQLTRIRLSFGSPVGMHWLWPTEPQEVGSSGQCGPAVNVGPFS